MFFQNFYPLQKMPSKISTVSVLFMFFFMAIRSSGTVEFIFNAEWSRHNKNGTNLMLSGDSTIDKLGFLKLTDATAQLTVGHAFYSTPIPFKNSSKGNSNKTSSFSTTFVFAISHPPDSYGGHGLAFAISPSKFLPGAFPSQYLGLFNSTTNGYASNHVVAIEFDTIQNPEWGDINRNHVGIDINSLTSLHATSPYYYTDGGEAKVLELASGEPLQVWVDYDGEKQQLNVYIAPAKRPKPTKPLLSPTIDLSGIVMEDMYVGFSASTGEITSTQYICGWSFKMEGEAPTLNLSNLSLLPSPLSSGGQSKKKSNVLKIVLPVIFVVIFLSVVISGVVVKARSIRSAEELEDWEKEFGPHRFAYKDLFTATKGFAAREVLGTGGFGKVYRGVLPTSKIEIAVKRVSHDSSQGMREFVAEIVSLGHLRHRNLVQLLGYCRRREELLIVYEYVPNGSLDKHLFNQNSSLSWKQRIGIVHGVASGLLYLHEEWDQVVLHRDIKASNVLLDGDYNARLGDFGLARLYSHGSIPETTNVAGTCGYIAPEFARTGKSTTSTDVFAFGTFMLEVVTGRRPVDPRWSTEEQILGDWVLQCWRRGSILEAMDPKLGTQYVVEEVEMVLKLGLFCSHPVAAARPSMPQVMQILEGDASLPQLSDYDLYIILEAGKNGGNLDNVMCKDLQSPVNWSSISASVLRAGR